ncbi:hypothetical protein [Cochleicola gelatinilyticus]|nr:hypothetical protein [Cochleicola gelatinilyticus]
MVFLKSLRRYNMKLKSKHSTNYLLVSFLLLCFGCLYGCMTTTETTNPIHKKSIYKKKLRKKITPEAIGITPNILYNKTESSYQSTGAEDTIFDEITLAQSAVVFNKAGDLFYVSETKSDSLLELIDINTSVDYLYKTRKNKYRIWKHYKIEEVDTFLPQQIKVKEDTLIISESSTVGYRNWSYYIKKNESE